MPSSSAPSSAGGLGSNDDEVGEDAETGETGETSETSEGETSEGETSGGGSDTPAGLDRPADPVVVLGAQLPALTQVDAAYARTIDAEGRGADCGDGECSEGEASSCAMDCAPVDGSCGDSICEPPENSTSCLADCPNGGGGGMGAECGNGACDGVENQLSCAPDCWAPFSNQVACVEANCEGLLDACADEQECVDVTVCVGGCVAGGGALNACLTDCAAQVMPAQVNLDTANAMFACGNMAGCF
ncbi:hypothetical protein PPSIR1_25126 [Plesiocystis pacifica SIR-1]|uniref:Uncharacterized protein n=1 Tax=Plesiocystis pacifica SIR-1 TaxID=391625 RepID=A6GDX3_9BACT|nr:hypothetical protein [Plesiocystis pacifica]EDM75922.1 hypothetical protein PPSIR1_25126 [Plesiocystis pacifica SIR-1]